MTTNILILGGGFGGVRAALDLAEHMPKNTKITVLDKNPNHYYVPDFYRMVSAFLPEGRKPKERDFLSLVSAAAVPLKTIFRGHPHVQVAEGEVAGIFPEENRVETRGGANFSYDWLIVALGSESDYCGIEGVRERAYPVKSPEETLNLRNAVDELFSRKAKHDCLRIVIVGGGFAGCELAGGLHDLARRLFKVHARPKDSCEIRILEAGDRMLAGASPRAAALAVKRLNACGVKVSVHSAVSGITDSELLLQGGERIPYDVVVWTAGVCGSSIAAGLSNKQGRRGRIAVDRYLRLPEHQNIFAVGDLAYFSVDGGRPLEMTAQAAIHEGRYVAYTLRRILAGRRPFPYAPYVNKYLIDLGGRYAVFDSRFIKFAGRTAWLMKRLVSLMYMSEILPWSRTFAWWRRNIRSLR